MRFATMASSFQSKTLQIILFIFYILLFALICACVCVYMCVKSFIFLYFYKINKFVCLADLAKGVLTKILQKR